MKGKEAKQTKGDKGRQDAQEHGKGHPHEGRQGETNGEKMPRNPAKTLSPFVSPCLPSCGWPLPSSWASGLRLSPLVSLHEGGLCRVPWSCLPLSAPVSISPCLPLSPLVSRHVVVFAGFLGVLSPFVSPCLPLSPCMWVNAYQNAGNSLNEFRTPTVQLFGEQGISALVCTMPSCMSLACRHVLARAWRADSCYFDFTGTAVGFPVGRVSLTCPAFVAGLNRKPLL